MGHSFLLSLVKSLTIARSSGKLEAMFQTLIVFLIPLIFGMNSALANLDEGEIQKRIEQILSERHPSDDSQDWKSLGKNAPKVILKLIRKEEKVYRRIRLIQALAWFEDPEAVEFLKDTIQNSENRMFRDKAIQTYALSQGERSIGLIRPFLEAQNEHTRLLVARVFQSLAQSGSEDAKKILADYEKKEKTPWVLARLKSTGVDKKKLLQAERKKKKEASVILGVWKGYWVFLEKKQDHSSLKVKTAQLEILPDGKRFKGKLKIEKQKEVILLTQMAPSGLRTLNSVWKNDLTKRVSGEWSREKDALVLRLEVPHLGATLVLSR